MKVRSLKFNVLEPDVIVTLTGKPNELVPEQKVTRKGALRLHEWALGLGPCGRVVTELTVGVTLSTVTIHQRSDPQGFEKTRDEFVDLMRQRRGPFGLNSVSRARYHELRDIVRDASKLDVFVYKLEDVQGRIKFEGL